MTVTEPGIKNAELVTKRSETVSNALNNMSFYLGVSVSLWLVLPQRHRVTEKRLVNTNPPACRHELFFLEIDCHHICAHRTDTTIRSVRDRRCQARWVFVKSLERIDQLFTTNILAGPLQSLNQNFHCAVDGNLCRSML